MSINILLSSGHVCSPSKLLACVDFPALVNRVRLISLSVHVFQDINAGIQQATNHAPGHTSVDCIDLENCCSVHMPDIQNIHTVDSVRVCTALVKPKWSPAGCKQNDYHGCR